MPEIGTHYLDAEDKALIFKMAKESHGRGYKRKQTVAWIARETGFSEDQVHRFLKSLESTVEVAQAQLRAGASKMVERVIEKAPTNELIDILSRPNIGVLEPIKKDESAGGGFFMTVSAEYAGAVKIGVAAGGSHGQTERETTGVGSGAQGAEVEGLPVLDVYPEVEGRLEDGATNHPVTQEQAAESGDERNKLLRIEAAKAKLKEYKKELKAQGWPHQEKAECNTLHAILPPAKKPRKRRNRPDFHYKVNLSYPHESFDEGPDEE